MLRSLASITNRVVVITLVVMGIGVGLARLLLPLAADFRAEIEGALEEAIGRQVAVGSIKGRWHGFGPQLILQEVKLSMEQGKATPLHFSEIRVDFSLMDSLRSGTPVPTMLSLANAHLRLRQQEDGEIRLLGINDLELGGQGGDGDGLDLKELPLGVGLIDSEITLETPRSNEPLRLYNLNLKLRQAGGFYKMEVGLQVGGHTANHVKAAARLRGDPARPGDWDSDFYLAGEALALEALLKHFVPQDFKQLSGLAEFQVWGRVEKGRLQRLEGDIALQGVTIARELREGDNGYVLNQLQGQFRWRLGNGGWRLELVNVQLKRNNTLWPTAAVTVQVWQDAARLTRLETSSSFLRLQDFLSAVKLFPPAEEGALEALQQLQPSGDLHDLRFTFNDTGSAPHWELSGRAERLRLMGWEGLPGINNLSVKFRANRNGGSLNLDSNDLLLDFPDGLLRHPVRLKRLVGPLQWTRGANGTAVHSEALGIDTPDFQTRSRFSLHIPTFGSPQLDLQTELSNGDIAYLHQYLPAGIMNPNLVKRLDRGLVAGNIRTGRILFHGPVEDFPFDKTPSGRFEGVFGVEDAIFDYQEGWPRLEGMDAEFHFLNNSFDAKIFGADIYASRVEKAAVRIESLEPVSPLVLDGVISGPLSDDLRVLSDSPLSERFGPIVSAMEVEGSARLSLHLVQALALDDDSDPTLIGALRFHDNSLRMPKWEVDLTKASGELHFDENKVWADNIKARGLGTDLRLDVESPKEGPRRTLIHAHGRFDIKTLMDRYTGLPLPHIKGTTNWHLTVDLPHSSRGKDSATALSLTSNLEGVSIDLPPPIGKENNSHQPLLIELSPTAPNKSMPVNIRLEGVADALLVMTKSVHGKRDIDRVGISFGGEPARQPEQEGLYIKGQLSRFKLDPWLEMLPPSQESGPTNFRLREVDVNFGRFEYKDLALDQIRLNGGPTPDGWRGMVDSPQIKGLIELPRDLQNGIIRLDLEKYAVHTDKGEADLKRSPNKFDPRSLPSFHVDSKHLIFNGHDLGRLSLRANKQKDGLYFDQIKVASDWFNLDGSGNWLYGKLFPGCASRFRMETKNLGRLLEAFAFTANIKDAPGRIEGNLTWPGDPTDLKNLNLNGELDLRLRKGRFTELEPGVGRVFGLLNLGALQRRLTLDFSDFFGRGLGFDHIDGRFALEDGDAYTHNLVIEGPTSVINISGRTGLVSKDFDQQVTVTPDLTGTLATAGAIAGGPVIGAALFVTNKIIGRELNKVSTTHYEVSGPWDNPRVEASTRQTKSPNAGETAKPKGFNVHDR
ncbi:MAG: TIGR02099 family protein [Gammaproteobacteria bacterium]|nr:TIGR02099 family protein [Gammaproteobacteria bacterium]MBU1653944.1 TIGR02099 family protein [Gammaproteobacteria bacterium]MBU1962644.1 TIGR02099 family protein [Gammaproteobacteria bacterium]